MPLSGSRRMEALSSHPPRRRPWRIRLAILISLLIHIVVGVLLLVTIRREENPEQLPPPSAVTMLFETGRKNGPTLPKPAVRAAPSTPPAPAPSSPPGQAIAPPPPIAPPSPPPVAPPAAPRPVEPVPSRMTAPPPPPPPVAEQEPPPSPPVAEQEPLPLPPPVAKPLPAPKPAPARRPVPPKPSDFPAPMNFSFGTPLAAPPSQAFSRSRPHIPGTIDMSLGPAARGAADRTPLSDRDKEVEGADWRNALSNWVAAHAYYPDQARRDGEEGDAKVHVVAAPNGRVEMVELVGKSGSMWLDLALLALFRDQHIPPLPYGNREPIEFNFTMHYVLIRPR